VNILPETSGLGEQFELDYSERMGKREQIYSEQLLRQEQEQEEGEFCSMYVVHDKSLDKLSPSKLYCVLCIMNFVFFTMSYCLNSAFNYLIRRNYQGIQEHERVGSKRRWHLSRVGANI
jgi:hypothetical protein